MKKIFFLLLISAAALFGSEQNLTINDYLMDSNDSPDVSRTIQAMLNKGADINEQDLDSNTPLLNALLQAKPNAALTLIDQGADWHVATADGKTPLDIATEQNFTKVVNAIQGRQAVESKKKRSPAQNNDLKRSLYIGGRA